MYKLAIVGGRNFGWRHYMIFINILGVLIMIIGLSISLAGLIYETEKANRIWDQCGMELKIAIFFAGFLIMGLGSFLTGL